MALLILWCTGVGEVFALEPDLWSALGAAEFFAQVGGVVEGSGTADVVGEEV